MTIEQHDKRQWYKVSSLGPFNSFDFPLWIRWMDWPEVREPRFFWDKSEMENTCKDWKAATHWRPAEGDSGQYRVMQIVDRFVPQELISGKWTDFREMRNNGKSYATLEDAKRSIAYNIDQAHPESRVIHPYP